MVNRKAVIGGAAGVAAVALVAGISVIWPGLDAQETPPQDSSVWALQTGEGRRYARVNTAVGELDTVRQAANPTSIVQAASGAYLFADSNGRIAKLDAAQPADLDEETLRADSEPTPPGTKDVATAGEYVAYRTDSGGVYSSRLGGGANQINPYAADVKEGDEVPDYVAAAATVGADGVVYSYAPADKAVLRYSIPERKVLGSDPVKVANDEDLQMTVVGDTWFLFDPAEQEVWERDVKAAQKVETGSNPLLAKQQTSGDATYLADEFGLIRLPLGDEQAKRVTGQVDRERGAPARPTAFKGVMYAAWFGTDEGTLWRAGDPEVSLSYAGKTLDDVRVPQFAASGSQMILNETRSGWVWTVPDGKLIPSSQDWSLDQQIDEDAPVSEVQATLVLDPKPPVAVPDSFGVRAGAITTLPVLLNDHDPNEDVLSVDPTSISGLDPKWGSVSLTDGGGRLSVHVAAGATGSAGFSYRVTDGTTTDGLYSETTTVALTVVPDDQNSAPVFCGVKDCLAKWPEPEVKPGGTIRVPVLNGWVDPDGDPLMLLGVTSSSEAGSAAVTQTGEVVFQHTNPSSSETEVIDLDVVVADARGAKTTKALKVKVTPTPKIEAEGFTVVDTAGSDMRVDVMPHVTASAGDVVIDTVRLLDESRAEVSAVSGTTSFDFSSKSPGVYRVAYTVKDSQGAQADATARITLLAPDAAAQLATSPVVAFVRPQEDATVDVFAAVTNPTRRVLLLNNVIPQAAEGASLQVDVVGQQFLRVSGTTANAEPGPLGVVKYTVSDGSDAADARVTGQATVYLLPPPQDFAPIAVNDAVTVRAGGQVDIPVLDNDVAPSGAALILNPAAVQTEAKDSLAFASGSVVRYLAPKKPGTYAVTYGVYSAGAPAKMSTATISVTVIGDETNRPPQPKVLEGRVLAGATVTIPFSQYGVDPDGDAVSIDRIASAPEKGAATVLSDGTGIQYTAAPGSSGQVTFDYRVTDSAGESRNGTVRVGVLDEASNPSPVAYTDYVQVQVGKESVVRVSPLKNDIDPSGGTLKLTDVVPNVAEKSDEETTNPEFTKWSKLIKSKDKTQVVIGAGEDPGTMSFLYDVESTSGNTGRGMIVVKVVREDVPDYPVVADSVLTVETRDQFERGVDVLAGKVSWSGGDASTLKLGLWGASDDVKLSGSSLSGELPKKARIIPFSVTGKAVDGSDVTTYAFLRVPGADDKQISLKAGLPPFNVVEKQQVSFDMNKITAIPRGSQLQIAPKAATMQVRPNATCTVGEAGNVTYDAGEGAPWADACLVQARLAGQGDWTTLSVPIRVTALDPVPLLKPASLTVSPGSKGTFDLKTMVSWQGREDWANLAFTVDQPGSGFTVAQNGSSVVVEAAATAVPGTETAATIGISSHKDVSPAQLTLRVGPAPSTLPKAGTVQKTCAANSGSSCSIAVVGAPGEVNPLPATPLKLIGVSSSSSCTGVSFAVADSSTVVASWASDAPGSSCTASFTLEDAQGRPTGGDGAGTILFDFRGYPRGPASLTQVRFGDGTLGLQVDPGSARDSYPALTGFTLTGAGGVSVACSADGACPDIPSPNGEKRAFEVVALNEVGRSATSAATTAWSYRPPNKPSGVTFTPVPNGNDGKLVRLDISGIDAAQSRELVITGGETKSVSIAVGQTTASVNYNVGSNSPTAVAVTPSTRFEVPPGTGPTSTTGEAYTLQANGIGAPLNPSVSGTETGGNRKNATITVTASASANGVAPQVSIVQGDSCGVAGPAGSPRDFTVRRTTTETFTVCARSVFNGQDFGLSTASTSVRPNGDTTPPSGSTFTVGAAPLAGSDTVRWDITDVSLASPPQDYVTKTNWNGSSDVYGSDPGLLAWFVANDGVAGDVSQNETIKPSGAPYQARGSWGLTVCKGGDRLDVWKTQEGATVTLDTAGAQFTLADGTVTPAGPDGKVPPTATAVTIGVTVTPPSGLTGYTATLDGSCTPKAP